MRLVVSFLRQPDYKHWRKTIIASFNGRDTEVTIILNVATKGKTNFSLRCQRKVTKETQARRRLALSYSDQIFRLSILPQPDRRAWISSLYSNVHNRADAITTPANLNANCPSGEERSSTGKRDYIKRSNDKKDIRRLGGGAGHKGMEKGEQNNIKLLCLLSVNVPVQEGHDMRARAGLVRPEGRVRVAGDDALGHRPAYRLAAVAAE